MFKPTEEEMREMYSSYLGEIEMFDGDWGLSKAMSFEEWKADQEEYDYYSFQGI